MDQRAHVKAWVDRLDKTKQQPINYMLFIRSTFCKHKDTNRL